MSYQNLINGGLNEDFDEHINYLYLETFKLYLIESHHYKPFAKLKRYMLDNGKLKCNIYLEKVYEATDNVT